MQMNTAIIGWLSDGSYRIENLSFTTHTITALTPPAYEDVVVEDVVIDAIGTYNHDLV